MRLRVAGTWDATRKRLVITARFSSCVNTYVIAFAVVCETVRRTLRRLRFTMLLLQAIHLTVWWRAFVL